MRILHWTDDYLPRIGGAEVFVHDLAREQQSHGHEVMVAAMSLPGSPERETLDGVPVRRHPVSHREIQAQPAALGRLLRSSLEIQQNFCPDIVHLHGHVPVPWLHLGSRSTSRTPSLLTVHGPLETCDPGRLRLCQQVGAVVTVSQHLQDHLPEAVVASAARIVTIHNGVRWPAQELTSPPPGEPVVLALGRLIREKGFDTAVRAMQHLSRGRLIIAGDGPELGPLKQLTEISGLSDRVSFKGWIIPSDVPALMSQCTMVVMPSRWQEPFGLVAVQAGQLSRPLIASQVGGLPEIVQHQKTGLLVPPDHPTALADAIKQIIEDPTAALRMAAAAQTRARADFSIFQCGRKYEALYRELLS